MATTVGFGGGGACAGDTTDRTLSAKPLKCGCCSATVSACTAQAGGCVSHSHCCHCMELETQRIRTPSRGAKPQAQHLLAVGRGVDVPDQVLQALVLEL